MTNQAKALTTKSENLSSIPKIHMGEGDKRQVILHVCAHTHKLNFFKKRELESWVSS